MFSATVAVMVELGWLLVMFVFIKVTAPKKSLIADAPPSLDVRLVSPQFASMVLRNE